MVGRRRPASVQAAHVYNWLGDDGSLTNVRTLMGVTDQMGLIPPNAAPAGSPPAGPISTSKLPPPAELQAQGEAQNLANMQILFSMPNTSDTSANVLPNIAGETAQQIQNVSIQSSRVALEFSTIATLFGPHGSAAITAGSELQTSEHLARQSWSKAQ
jgi:hypothetical protein